MSERETCVEVVKVDNVTIVDLEGEIDIYTATDFKKALLAAIDEGARRIVVDVSNVEFMDSTGLSVLVSGERELRANGGSLAVVCGPKVRRLLKITGLESAFALYDSRDDAPRALFTNSSGPTG